MRKQIWLSIMLGLAFRASAMRLMSDTVVHTRAFTLEAGERLEFIAPTAERKTLHFTRQVTVRPPSTLFIFEFAGAGEWAPRSPSSTAVRPSPRARSSRSTHVAERAPAGQETDSQASSDEMRF